MSSSGRRNERRRRPERQSGGKQRRALSTVNRGGRTGSGGEARAARGLLDALTAPSYDDKIAKELTHSFHAYPARMHPATARAVLEGLAPKRILDPFCGSGTTLVEAVRGKAAATGIDANPLAVMLAQTKTWLPGGRRVRELSRVGRAIADEALDRVRDARRAKATRAEERSTRPRTRKGLSGWFPPHILAELETLASLIRESGDEELRPHLNMVLSSLLYKVSLRASDTDASRVRRQVPRGAPSRHFRERVIELSDALRALAYTNGPPPEIRLGDARELGDIRAGSVDLVLSSPPYPGTYNYLEHHQLRMDFLGIDASSLARAELGARRHFSGGASSLARGLTKWRADMQAALKGMRAALTRQGKICLLVGDSMAGGTALRADAELPPIAKAVGLELVAWAWQTRRALGTREAQAFRSPAKREHLLLFAPA